MAKKKKQGPLAQARTRAVAPGATTQSASAGSVTVTVVHDHYGDLVVAGGTGKAKDLRK